MLTRLSPFATLTKAPRRPPQPSSSGRPLLTPLEVPELLQLIFSFLSRRSLRIVILVCRQWLYLNQDRLRRELVWDNRWKHSAPFHSLRRLPGAERLVLNTEQMEPGWNSPDLRSLLQNVQASSAPSPVVRLGLAVGALVRTVTKSHPIKGFFHPLRELDISSRDFKKEWVNTLPFPLTLTSLKIDKFWEFQVDVARILIICPLLEFLELCSYYNVTVQGPYTDRGKDALPARLPLRSLVLTNLKAPQAWLEDLLTVTPDLETLKLIEHEKYWAELVKDRWDWDRFRTHLQALSLPRKQLFYAEFWHHHLDALPLATDFTICPNTQERTFLYYDLTPKVITLLKEQPVFLTSLEIIKPKYACCVLDGWVQSRKVPYTARPLHQLLCECPNLRHLRTLKMPCMPDFMDVHRRTPMYPALVSEDEWHPRELQQQEEQETPPPIVPGIWICRGLETLHLELHIHDRVIEKGTHHSRILYGYIASVCPQLIDLRIRFPHGCYNPSTRPWKTIYKPYILEGGLCLLSKLRYLERLWIVHGNFVCESASELNWVAKSGRTEANRIRRREIVDGWRARLEEEAALESSRLESCSGVAGEVLGIRADEEGVMSGLRSLGLLQDVVDTVADMDTDERNILPELFKTAFGSYREQNPEKEMSRLFHGPSISLKAKMLSWVSS